MLNKDELVDWRRVLNTAIRVDAIMYIDAILFDTDYQKGRAHWDMIEHLCEYVTGNTFEDDSSLYLCLHDKSQKITDNLDKTIGLKIENTYRERTNKELDGYGYKLAAELIKMVESVIRDNTTYSRKTKEQIPTKLISPTRRIMNSYTPQR